MNTKHLFGPLVLILASACGGAPSADGSSDPAAGLAEDGLTRGTRRAECYVRQSDGDSKIFKLSFYDGNGFGSGHPLPDLPAPKQSLVLVNFRQNAIVVQRPDGEAFFRDSGATFSLDDDVELEGGLDAVTEEGSISLRVTDVGPDPRFSSATFSLEGTMTGFGDLAAGDGIVSVTFDCR